MDQHLFVFVPFFRTLSCSSFYFSSKHKSLLPVTYPFPLTSLVFVHVAEFATPIMSVAE